MNFTLQHGITEIPLIYFPDLSSIIAHCQSVQMNSGISTMIFLHNGKKIVASMFYNDENKCWNVYSQDFFEAFDSFDLANQIFVKKVAETFVKSQGVIIER